MEVITLQAIDDGIDSTCLADKFSFEMIKLENSKNSLVTLVNKLIVNSRGFLVFDNSSLPIVYSFDNKGNFLSKIGKYGHAKNEYDHILDVCSNDVGDSIVFLQYGQLKMFDDKGNYISSCKIDDKYHWEKLERNSEYGYVCSSDYTNADNILSVCNKSFEIEHEYINSKGVTVDNGSYVWNPIWCSHDKIVYCDFYFSSIYIEDLRTQHISCYKVNTGNTACEKGVKTKVGQYDHFVNVAFDGKYVFGHMVYDNKYKMYRLDTKTKKFSIYESVADWCPNIIAYHDGCFYEVLNPLDMISLKKSQGCPKWMLKRTYDALMTAMEPYVDDLNEMDNYYILKMEVRR